MSLLSVSYLKTAVKLDRTARGWDLPHRTPLHHPSCHKHNREKRSCGNYPFNSHSRTCFGCKPVYQVREWAECTPTRELLAAFVQSRLILCLSLSAELMRPKEGNELLKPSRTHQRAVWSTLREFALEFFPASKLHPITLFGLIRESFLYHSCESQGQNP